MIFAAAGRRYNFGFGRRAHAAGQSPIRQVYSRGTFLLISRGIAGYSRAFADALHH